MVSACLPCVLFSSSSYHGSDPGILVSQPLIASAKSLELLHKHTAKGHHKDSVVKADEFEKVMTHKQPDIQCRLDQVRADRIALNRRKLSRQCCFVEGRIFLFEVIQTT